MITRIEQPVNPHTRFPEESTGLEGTDHTELGHIVCHNLYQLSYPNYKFRVVLQSWEQRGKVETNSYVSRRYLPVTECNAL